MFTANKEIMEKSCATFGLANNSPEEIKAIHDNTKSIAASSGVDARFIFAVIIQESKGCVRVKTTSHSVQNPGLMQSHNGPNSCNENGVGTNPCPENKIKGMIQDGVTGKAGLKDSLATAGGTNAQSFYKTARIYNSGSLDPSGNMATNAPTPCYVSDVANRLVGFVGKMGLSECTLGK